MSKLCIAIEHLAVEHPGTLKPVLEAFGIIHPSGQQQLNFDEDPDDD